MNRVYFNAEHPPAVAHDEDDDHISVSWVLIDVYEESKRARDEYGLNRLTTLDWLAILAEEFGEVARSVNELEFSGDESQRENLYTECVQVAAVVVRMAAVVKASMPPA